MKISFQSPMRCSVCGLYACYDELPVCKYCLHRFNSAMAQRCEKCGKNVFECDCRKSENINCLFYYKNDFTAHGLIYYMKSIYDTRFFDFIAENLFFSCGINPKLYEAVTFVPRKPRRKRIFGVDQAEQIAKAISRRFGIPVIYTLERVGGRQQKTLTAKQRFVNIKGRYCLRRDLPEEKYNRILLVDDVCTTGATVKSCAKLLRGIVSRGVGIAVIARK